MFLSSLEQGSVLLYLQASFPPPCCPRPPFAHRQLFWGCVSFLLALGVCGVVMVKLSQGGPARLAVSIWKHFVPLPLLLAAGALKGTSHAGLVELIKLICFYLCQVLHVTHSCPQLAGWKPLSQMN